MGSPVVRRDELDEEIGKLKAALRKERAAGRKKADNPDQAFVTREQLRAEFVEFAKMLGLAPVEPEQLDVELDGSGDQLPDAEPVELPADEEHEALFETEGDDS